MGWSLNALSCPPCSCFFQRVARAVGAFLVDVVILFEVWVLDLRSLFICFVLFFWPGGMADGSVIPAVRRVTRASYSVSLSLESLKS